MKTVGIIGGLGIQTTARFYQAVVFACQEKNQLHRPPILLWNIPVSYQAEYEEIMHGIYVNEIPILLIDAAKKLENCGADFLVIPCNSAHVFIDRLRKEVNIPILSMIDETVNSLSIHNIHQVGLISTLITRQNALYNYPLSSRGIDFYMPSEFNQKSLNAMVLKLADGHDCQEEKNKILEVIDQFQHQGIKDIVLACAALEVLVSHHLQVKIHDTMKIFVQATAREILKGCAIKEEDL